MSEFKEPKCKKKFDNKKLFKQLPIPIEIFDKTKNCYLEHYTVYFSDGKVYVKDELEADCLYKYGCFGKSEFSRGNANLNTSAVNNFKNENDLDVSLSMKNIPLMSKERYDRRKEWAKRYNDLLNDEANVKKDDMFHETFLNEFLKTKAKLLNLDEFDQKPKCRLQLDKENEYLDSISISIINKQQESFSKNNQESVKSTERKKQNFLAPNFDPFSFVIKNIPNCIINEYSYLMFEEAFFLCYALGCLKVFKEEDQSELKIKDLWNLFSKYDKNFISKYIAYHKYRSKGWVLRNGIKYGCDFLAYYKGPEYYHASYSIIVKTTENKSSDQSLSSFAGLVRVNENASKEIIVCYVLFNPDDNDIDFKTPKCISKSGICEFLVNRWVPEHNRMEIIKANNNDSCSNINKAKTTLNQ